MPICSVCLNSDILCAKCASLIEKGEITETEASVSRAINTLSKETGMEIKFLRILPTKDTVIIIADSQNAGKLIGLGGRNVRRLSQLLLGDVRIIENGPERHMIENVLRVQVAGVNKIYGGREAYRIRIRRKDLSYAQRSLFILEHVLGKKVFLTTD